MLVNSKKRLNSKAKVTLILISLMFTIALISGINAFSSDYLNSNFVGMCYQETANSSTITDGSCILNYTGVYSFSGTCLPSHPCSNYFDGDWGTYADVGSTFISIVNYSKPSNYNYGSVWVAKTFNSRNATIPLSCLNSNSLSLMSSKNITFDYFYCYNSTNYIPFFNISDIDTRFYDEAMIWNISTKQAENITFNINNFGSLDSTWSTYVYDTNLSYKDNKIIVSGLNSGGVPVGRDPFLYTNSGTHYIGIYYNTTCSNLGLSLVDTDNTFISGNNENMFNVIGDSNYHYTLQNLTTENSYPNIVLGVQSGYNNCNVSFNQVIDYGTNPIRYLSIPSNTILTNGFMNLTAITNATTNLSLYIGNNQVINYSGNFTNSNNKTSNFANQINNYLSTCSYVSGYCNIPFIFHSDNSGILQYSDLNFNDIGFIENNQTFNPTVSETTTNNYTINITYDPSYYQVANAILVYNGTSYTSTKSTNGFNTIFTTFFSLPLINSSNINLFYWNISLTNLTDTFYYQSNTYNQTVNQLSLGECLGNNTIKVLNFTAYDQDTLAKLTNWNFKGTLNYFLGDGTVYRTVSFTNNSVNEKDICSNTTTIKVTGNVQYTASNYNSAEFNFINNEVNNSYPVKLFMGNNSLTTAFIIQVQTNALIPLANYFVYIFRYDPSSNIPNLIQTSKTDPQGQVVGNFIINTVDYQFIVADTNGNIVYTSPRQKVIPQTTPYTIYLSVGTSTPNPLNYFNNLSQITSSLSFNQNNNLVTWIYLDSNSSFNYGLLQINLINGSGTNLNLCNITSTNPSAVLTCDLTGNLTGTYNAIAYTNRNGINYQVDLIVFSIEGISNIDRNAGLFYGFLILLICSVIFAWNVSAGILAVDMGVIGIQILGLIQFSWLGVGAIVGASIILLIVLRGD